MGESIYNQIGGFSVIRKLITDFYDRVLDNEELSILFANTNMERIIDHQTKFFAMLLGGPASFSDNEIRHLHERLNITASQFEMTSELLTETLEDFELSDDHIDAISKAFNSKRDLIVIKP